MCLMIWNTRKQSDYYLRRLVEKGGLVEVLPSGELVGRMVAREVARPTRKSPWQFKVNPKTNCWEWLRSIRDGYGQIGYRGDRGAHRLYYTVLCSKIPPELTIDHLCRVRHCINPSHLEPVSMRTNVLRGNNAAAVHARKTHCIRGHSFSGDNLYVWNQGSRKARVCRTCGRNQKQKQRDKTKGER